MISQREVKRKYKDLILRVQNSDFYKIDLTNRYNCYVCSSCNHVTKTKDDAGVTPMMYKCEKCNSMGMSLFYRDIHPELKHSVEFYRPSLKETMKLRKEPHILDHIFSGGLMARKVKSDETQ